MNLLLSYDGRIGRGRFWLGLLLNVVCLFGLSAVVGGVAALVGSGGPRTDPASIKPGDVIVVVLGLAALITYIWMHFAVLAKRCHDRGKSGWMSLISMIPLAGPIWMIVDLGIIEGVDEANQWGPPAVPRR